jgi:hypothetical protein
MSTGKGSSSLDRYDFTTLTVTVLDTVYVSPKGWDTLRSCLLLGMNMDMNTLLTKQQCPHMVMGHRAFNSTKLT